MKRITMTAIVLAISSLSAFAQTAPTAPRGNCQDLFPVPANTKEFLSVKMGKANGHAHVVVFAEKTAARIASGVGVRWCRSTVTDDAAPHGIVYAVQFQDGEAVIPVAAVDAHLAVIAGGRRFNVYRAAADGEVTVQVPATPAK